VSAVVIPEGLEPLAVWDAREPSWVGEHWREKIAWAKEHIGRTEDTHRIDFCLLDAPFAVVHRYARNGDGYKHNGPGGKIATEPPVIVPLDGLPPAHLLR
jgi:hypothetical protein